MNRETLPQYWINHLGFLIRKRLSAGFAAEGIDLTAEEWAVLLLVQGTPGMTPGALSAASFRDRTTVTRMIDRMQAKALIARRADPDDRRVQRLALTGEGRALFARARVVAEWLIAQSGKGIPADDLAATVAVLRCMAENLGGGEGEKADGL